MIAGMANNITLTLSLLGIFVRVLWTMLRPRGAVAVENLFLRKQLAMYRERGVSPRRPSVVDRVTLVVLSKAFDWRDALAVVGPRTLTRWHRLGFRMLWRWKSRPGRPPIPAELRELIRQMGRENPAWGEERIANELLLKLGVQVSARTVGKYLPSRPPGKPRGDQRWSTFLRNHARAIIACDFCVVVSATFELFYVLVVMEHGSRRVIHLNATKHPTAQWTLQQMREAIASDHPYRFLVHDRDSIFSKALDTSVGNLGLRVLRTPRRSPKANALCERLIGTLRRECLDYLIPLGERHLRVLLGAWVAHYNRGRPHMALGPGVPDPPHSIPVEVRPQRHRLGKEHRIVSRPILGGLCHEYALEPRAA
jgi:putative transposase